MTRPLLTTPAIRLAYIATVAPAHNAMVAEIRAARIARERAEADAMFAALDMADDNADDNALEVAKAAGIRW